jgi:hypothetical protein
VAADDQTAAAPIVIDHAGEVDCLARWLTDMPRVLVIGAELGDLVGRLERSGHSVLVLPHLPSAVDDAPPVIDAIAFGDDLLSAADPVAAVSAALRIARRSVVVLSVANAASRDARLAMLDGSPPGPGGATRTSLFALARDAGGVVTALGRVSPPAGQRPTSSDRSILSPLVAPLLGLDPNAAALRFVVRVEPAGRALAPGPSDLESAILAEEDAAELQIRQVIAVQRGDVAALNQVRRDFVSLSRSRMVRWGSIPGRTARYAKRLAGRVLRLLRLRR